MHAAIESSAGIRAMFLVEKNRTGEETTQIEKAFKDQWWFICGKSRQQVGCKGHMKKR